jgi:hypothetical protein
MRSYGGTGRGPAGSAPDWLWEAVLVYLLIGAAIICLAYFYPKVTNFLRIPTMVTLMHQFPSFIFLSILIWPVIWYLEKLMKYKK